MCSDAIRKQVPLSTRHSKACGGSGIWSRRYAACRAVPTTRPKCFDWTARSRAPCCWPPRPPESDGDSSEARRRAGVLIIDDEPALLRVLARILGRTHQAVTAHTADDARSAVREFGSRIDLILCDVLMADVNGVDLRDD